MSRSRYKLQVWLNQWEASIRAAKKKNRGKKKELAIAQEAYGRLHVVSRAVADGDFDTAVFSAVQFGIWVGEWGKLIPQLTGQKFKATREADRREYFRDRYLVHRPGSKNKKDACRKADEDTNKKFPKIKPYTQGSWYSLVKGLPKP